MSYTMTVHWICDGCGRQQDVTHEDRTDAYRPPDGWASGFAFASSFCSLPCAEGVAQEDARKWAESLFAKQSEPVA